MVARGAGDVGCAHCTLIGADRACPICTHLICERCAADWATCTEPSGRVVRLGLTARLRDVDPGGRLGLVSHWRQPLRLFDLRQLSWVRAPSFPRHVYLSNRMRPPRLTSDLRLVQPEWLFDSDGIGSFVGMRFAALHSHDGPRVMCEPPGHGTAVTAVGDRFYYVTETERVAIVTASTSVSFEPLPRKVVQAVHVDAERDLLASASWSELALHRIVGDQLTLLSHTKTETTGDVRWVAVARAWHVAIVITVGGGARVEVRRLERDSTIGELVHRHSGSEFRAASLSRDGRYLALALETSILVHELGSDRMQQFYEHTDHINLLRFVGDDHLLVSADTDNRIVMRPRTPTGYAEPVVEIQPPAELVELPDPRDERIATPS